MPNIDKIRVLRNGDVILRRFKTEGVIHWMIFGNLLKKELKFKTKKGALAWINRNVIYSGWEDPDSKRLNLYALPAPYIHFGVSTSYCGILREVDRGLLTIEKLADIDCPYCLMHKGGFPFLADLYKDPDDFVVRLIYADWLQDNGNLQEARRQRRFAQDTMDKFNHIIRNRK